MDICEIINNGNNDGNTLEGIIYCLFNVMFIYYGVDVYKLGKTKDIDMRLKGYITSYIEPCEIKYVSRKIRNCSLAENILFIMLQDYRISSKREFFKCDINKIIETINYIENLFEKHSDDELNEMFIVNNKLKFALTKEDIFNSSDISTSEYNIIVTQMLNIDDYLNVEKYLYKINWNLEQIDENMMDKIYRKTHILFNNRAINNLPIKTYKTVDNEYVDFDKKTKLQQLKIVNELLLMLKLKDKKNNFTNSEIDENEWIKLVENAKHKSTIFTDKSILLFFDKNKTNVILTLTTYKKFIGYINSILKHYGIKIQKNNYGKHKKKSKTYIQQTNTMQEINSILLNIDNKKN